MTGQIMKTVPGKNEHATEEMPSFREVVLLATLGLAAGIVCFLIFWNFPDLDMQVVSGFADENGHFFRRGDVFLAGVRKAVLFFIFFFYVLVIAGGLESFKKQQPVIGFTWDKWAFVGACALIGPVMIVNVILKGNWGRARPRFLEEFGGTLEFTPFWVWADQCRDNCSFTSGEVAGVAMVFLSVAFVLGLGARYLVFLAAIIASAFIAWVRFAMGAHFPSDTVMSVVFMLIVGSGTYYLFFLRPAPWIGKLNRLQIDKLNKENSG